METRKLGGTDMVVTRLGFGGARIGFEKSSEDEVGRLLNGMLDAGVNFIDTAACYDGSEELIGNAIGSRRTEYYLVTKAGHVVGDATGEPYSHDVISSSIDRSLERLKADVLDLVQLHSCSVAVLRQGEAAAALAEARDAGKTRYIGYSGDGAAALEAIRMGVFDTLQTSFNLVDQSAAEEIFPAAIAQGMGIIAKRPIANGAFDRDASPYGYADEYWRRSNSLTAPDGAPGDRVEFSLRFTLSFDEVDTAILGTSNADHAVANVSLAEAGPLDASIVSDVRKQFRQYGGAWTQLT